MCQLHPIPDETTSPDGSPTHSQQSEVPVTPPQNVVEPVSVGPVAWVLIQIVRFYKFAISPMLGNNCRFIPTCSEYFILAVKKYGPLRGTLMGIGRILRCHPFCRGGVDFP